MSFCSCNQREREIERDGKHLIMQPKKEKDRKCSITQPKKRDGKYNEGDELRSRNDQEAKEGNKSNKILEKSIRLDI